MNSPTDSTGVPWKHLIVSGLGIIAVLWLFSWYNGRKSQPTAIPVVPRQVQQDRESRELSSRLNPSEQAALQEFADGANSRDPLVREATLRNMDLVGKVRSIVMENQEVPTVWEVVRLLGARLKDDSPAVRMAAVEAIVPGYLDRWHSDPPYGLAAADAFAVGEALLTEKDPTIRLRAAVHLWVRNESATAGKVLISIVEDAKATLSDRILAAKAKRFTGPPHQPDGMLAALAGVIADPIAPMELRTTAVEAIKSGGDNAKRSLSADLRVKLQSSLKDATLPGEMRADVLNLLIPVYPEYPEKPLPNDLLKTLAKLAAAIDTPVPLRVRAFGLLEPLSASFAKDYPELAMQLQAAVTDIKQDPAFRAFAAYSYMPDTADKFATVVRFMATADQETVVLRWTLAGRLAAHYPEGKRPPKEWLTIAVAKLLPACPPAFPVPQNVRLYHDLRYPMSAGDRVHWLGDYRPVDIRDLTSDLLVSRWTDVLAELLAPHNNSTVRERNQRVLERVLKDQPAALWKALHELAKDAKAAETVRLQAMNWLYAGDQDRWPKDVYTSWSERLVAEDIGREEKQLILKWALSQHSSPVQGYCSLLDTQRGAVRALVAEEVARIGPAAKAAIPHVIEALKAEYQTTTAPYVSALAAMGRESVPALGGLMKDKEPKLRTAAATALGLIGPEGRSEATPFLRTAVEQEKNEGVKKAALEALGQVNPAEAKKFGWVAK